MILSFRDERKILEKHVELEDKLLHLFTQDEIDDKKLYNILDEMNKLRKKKVEIKRDLLNRRETLDPQVSHAYSICFKEIHDIQDKLIKNEIPTININNVISFLKVFANFYLEKKEITQDETNETNETNEDKELNLQTQDTFNNGKIIVVSEDETFPLKFRNGRKILLTTNNFDLSLFTHDELIELLRLLDVIVSDNRYDFLRSEIAKQISIISSISLFKDTFS